MNWEQDNSHPSSLKHSDWAYLPQSDTGICVMWEREGEDRAVPDADGVTWQINFPMQLMEGELSSIAVAKTNAEAVLRRYAETLVAELGGKVTW